MRNVRQAPAFWFSVLVPAIFLLVVLIPPTRHVFLAWTARQPYAMAFVKFALLATVGETVAGFIKSNTFRFAPAALAKAVIWGIIGMLIALLFPLYTAGVRHAQSAGLLPGSSGTLLTALVVSIILNFTFGVVMMAAHRITDAWLERRRTKDTAAPLLASIDWPGFISFVVAKTIPFFWIPAHTITFLLPEGFRVIWSAMLSIALGLILALAKKRVAA